jgi:hypothetical protein
MKKIIPRQLTESQFTALYYCAPGESVKDVSTLRKLSKLGVVKLHEHTGEIVKHVWGMPVRASYIDDADTFEVEGVGVFRRKFFSGCFCPYLIKAELDAQGRIIC